MWFVLLVLYLSFIGLGMSDSLLGVAWPSMNGEYLVPVSFAGASSAIVAIGKVTACLTGDWLNRKFGEARMIAVSAAAMALGLFGIFGVHQFWALLLFSVPFGLGCGYVNVTACSYAAVHYESCYNSWLQCMWGVGGTICPMLMGWSIAGPFGWSLGYLIVGILEVLIIVLVFMCRSKWKHSARIVKDDKASQAESKYLPFYKVITLPGVAAMMCCFFFSNGIQDTSSLWAGSYLVMHKGLSAEMAAAFVSALFIGITLSRLISGFMTMHFTDTQMVRIGCLMILLGLLALLFLPNPACAIGLIFIGIGFAPVLPCMLHMTADIFGPEQAPAILNAELAVASAGSMLMPPVFGLIANHLDIRLFPAYLAAAMALLYVYAEKTGHRKQNKNL